jgi:sulfur-carrier protein
MAVSVRIPTTFRPLTGGSSSVEVEGSTVRDVLASLESQHPGFADRILDEGALRKFVNVFVGDEDIRFLSGLDTEVPAGEMVAIIPAVAGG